MCLQGELKENEFKIVSGPQQAPLDIHWAVRTEAFCLCVKQKGMPPSRKHYFKLLHPV